MKRIYKVCSKGTTLFEVLLYIALFTILSGSVVFLYISFLKAADSMRLNIQKTEISMFVRQLVEYQLDTNREVDTTMLTASLERILRYYPNLILLNIEAEYVLTESSAQIIDSRSLNGTLADIFSNTNSILKLTYQLVAKVNNATSSNTIYFRIF